MFSSLEEDLAPSDDAKVAARETQAVKKAEFQWEQEFAEEEINIKRDAAFIQNVLTRWSDRTKAAILNAGCSHQFHISRKLKFERELSFIHIEQPCVHQSCARQYCSRKRA
jgi:hypothetical protein